MPFPKYTDDEFIKCWNNAMRQGKTVDELAIEMGYTASRNLYRRKRRLQNDGHMLFDPERSHRIQLTDEAAEVTTKAGSELVEEIINRREPARQIKEKQTRPKKITIDDDRPIAIAWIGDTHLDDDGTDLAALRDHLAVIRNTDGLFAAFVGDMNNSWIGRLGQIYAAQRTTEDEGWQLAEWFFEQLGDALLITVAGNHDLWNRGLDPLKHLISIYNANCAYDRFQVIADINAGGKRFDVILRHRYKGHSDWNDVHALLKRLITRKRFCLAVGGDKHTCSSIALPIEDIDGKPRIVTALQVGSYKQHDDFQRERDFRYGNVSPIAVTVFNTLVDAHHPDFIKVYWDVETGADVLTRLRQ